MTISKALNSKIKRQVVTLLSALGLLGATAIPTSVQAGEAHFHSSVISVGFHNVHHYKKKHYKRGFKKHRSRSFKRRSYNNNYYNYRGKQYYNRSYKRNYSSPYYYGGKSKRYNNSSSYYCPYDGYSSSYIEDRGCYKHKGHYHCD